MIVRLLFLFSVLIIAGCVGQNSPVLISQSSKPVATVSPVVIKQTPLPVATPVSIKTNNPEPTVSEKPLQVTPTPIPSPVQSPLTSTLKVNTFNVGIGNVFEKITNNTTDDASKETTDTINALININASYVIVDFKQKMIDSNLDSERLSWSVYDEILNGLRAQDIHAILRVNQDSVLYSHDSPPSNSAITTPVINYISFLEQAEYRYRDYNISWMFGKTINDQNSLPGTQQDYVDFLAISSDAVKRINPARVVYMGSFVQSEIFGQKHYFTAENLLSYLNLGVAKYTDGFFFEIYSLAYNDNKDFNSQSQFKGTDYKLVKNYYDSITEILKQKKIENKKLFLITSTYANTTVNELSLTEEQQANDLARRLVYSISTGFDRVYLPELSDKKLGDTANFFQRRGLLLQDELNLNSYKKLPYWTFKFLIEKLKDTTYKGIIENLPKNAEGFIFEKDKKQYYVLWNNDENFRDLISIRYNGNKLKYNIAPSDSSLFGVNIILTPDPSGRFNVSFNTSPQNLRILETID